MEATEKSITVDSSEALAEWSGVEYGPLRDHDLTEEEQFAKLRLVVELAEEIWG